MKKNVKIQPWKEKAKQRRIKIWSQAKRIEELSQSRDNWKAKYKEVYEENRELKRAVSAVVVKEEPKARGHKFDLNEISFFLNLREQGGCSYRGCLRVLEVVLVVCSLRLRRPCASTVRNWSIKLGYHKLGQPCPAPEGEWVLILDESVSVGSQKILLLLGVDLSGYRFEAPLSSAGVEVLAIRVRKSWIAEDIDKVLTEVGARGYLFSYACCDNGNNLRKALKMNGLEHIEDCGHCLGKILERRYKEDPCYQHFSNAKSLFQKQNLLSRHAFLLPPQQRTKGRFMNLWPTCEWASKMLSLAKGKGEADEDAREKVGWILEYEGLITRLHQEQQLVNKVNKILKHKGLCHKSVEQCREAAEKSGVDKSFAAEVMDYLERNMAKMKGEAPVLCSSDIIESMFGKFKNSLSGNSMCGLTEGSLTLANYGKVVTPESVKKPMEEVKIVDIVNWREENLPISMQRKRRTLLKNTG